MSFSQCLASKTPKDSTIYSVIGLLSAGVDCVDLNEPLLLGGALWSCSHVRLPGQLSVL